MKMTVKQKQQQGTSRGEEHTGNTHDDHSTQTATVAVVTQGSSRRGEHTGNTHADNSTQRATAKIVVNGSNYFRRKLGINYQSSQEMVSKESDILV